MDYVRFVAVARLHDRVNLAEFYASDPGNFPNSLMRAKVAKVLSSERVREHTRLTITDREVGSIHYDSDPICLYFVIANRDFSQRMSFKFLADVRAHFAEFFGSELGSASEGSLSHPARKSLEDLCRKYNSKGSDRAKPASVLLQVEEVKGRLQENIQEALRKTDSSSTLGEKYSNEFQKDAHKFKQNAAGAKAVRQFRSSRYCIGVLLSIFLLAVCITLRVLRSQYNAKGVVGKTVEMFVPKREGQVADFQVQSGGSKDPHSE